MPLIGVICGYDGTYKSFDECVCSHECGSRTCHAPVQVIKIMRDNHIDREGAGWSASTLTQCARAIALQETYDYYESVEAGWNKARGTWVHSMIESDTSPRPGLIRERRIGRTFKIGDTHIALTGKPDEVDTELGLLIDYKSKDLIPRQKDEKHEAQFNVYVWLLADGVFVDTGERVQVQIKGGGMHYLTWRPKAPFKKFAYPVWPDARIETFLRERLTPLVEWQKTAILPKCNAYVHYGPNYRCDCIKLEEQLRERGINVP